MYNARNIQRDPIPAVPRPWPKRHVSYFNGDYEQRLGCKIFLLTFVKNNN